jgi:hypothetical protein
MEQMKTLTDTQRRDIWSRTYAPSRAILDTALRYARAIEAAGVHQSVPAAREPLKVSAIEELAVQEQLFLVCDGLDDLVEIVRIIEKAHNITGAQK